MNSEIKQLRKQLGVGLIELMIAMALGVIIILGITEIATQNSLTRNELERTGRQIEGATYALNAIEKDVMNAAFWGERGELPATVLAPVCPDTAVELEQSMGYPIQGGQGEFDCLMVDASTKLEAKAGSDYIAVRRASSCPLEPGSSCDPAGANFHIQVNACFDPSSTLKPGEDFLIDNDVSNLVYEQRNCTDLAPIYRFISRIYYVDDRDRLVRAELIGSTYQKIDLVENVEMMRIEYGLDEDRDGQIESYIRDIDLPTDPAWDDVAMARIELVVRNHQPSAGYIDNRNYNMAGLTYTAPIDKLNYRRQLYTRTISPRNIAGRREQP